MKNMIKVLKFEYLTCIKNKAFIITTAIFMALILLMTFLPGIISSMNSEENVSVDELPVIAVSDKAYKGDAAVKKVLEKFYPRKEIKLVDEDVDTIKSKVDSSEYRFAVILDTPVTYTYVTKNNSLMNSDTSTLNLALTDLFRTVSLEQYGIPSDKAEQILNTSLSFQIITTGVDQTKNYWSTYILIMLLYMAIIMYGQMVSQSVVSEKNTRAMEMLITCAKPSHLMFGKVIGSGLAGLTQLVLITATTLASISTIGSQSIPKEILEFINFPLSTVLYALLFFILGYFIYSFLLGALSSLASRSEDLNTLTAPVMMLFVIAFFIVIMAVNSDSVNSTLMVVCSYIPFTAPIAMFARVSLADVSVIEISLSVAVQLISVYLLGMLAAAIYRIGVLMYGNPPKPSEIIKLLKAR